MRSRIQDFWDEDGDVRTTKRPLHGRRRVKEVAEVVEEKSWGIPM
jgi:hypothetical protein